MGCVGVYLQQPVVLEKAGQRVSIRRPPDSHEITSVVMLKAFACKAGGMARIRGRRLRQCMIGHGLPQESGSLDFGVLLSDAGGGWYANGVENSYPLVRNARLSPLLIPPTSDDAQTAHAVWAVPTQQKTTGINYRSLLKTIRDAVGMTLHLGVCRLWVDSLYTIQDDEDDLDWRSELAKMDSIYAWAVSTLSATRSSSVD